MEELPLHQCLLEFDPQSTSPFYDGRVPAEIRDQIFRYACTEDEATDLLSIYPVTFNRPGYRAKRTISTSLLLTCRRIYLETYHIPLRSKEHVFWHSPETGPPVRHGRYDRFGHEMEDHHFALLKPWQVELVKEMHLFTQMFWLEQSFASLCKEGYMQRIEKLKITLRKTDWWWNESNVPLAINPQRGIGGGPGHPNLMIEDIAANMRGGRAVPWNMNGWGGSFALLGCLKELEMEFEAADDKKAELVKIIEWAKTWRFPLKEGRVLSTEGCKVTSSSWDAPECFWSQMCPQCWGRSGCRPRSDTPAGCSDRMRRKLERLGPLCYVYTLKWRAAVE